MELMDNIHQQEEHRPQAEDSKNIGEENDIRVLGDGENGGNGIDGEKQICKLDNQHHQKKRSYQFFVINLHKKAAPFKLGMHRKIFGRQFYDGVILRVDG